jgi:D-alanine-D-alanine ligase-like ATP-grasp enzyme
LRRTSGPGPWCARRAWLLAWPLPLPAAGAWPAWEQLEPELQAGGLRWARTSGWKPPLARADHPAAWVATLAARLLQPAGVAASPLGGDPFAQPPRLPEPALLRPLAPHPAPALALESLAFELLGEALPLAADLLATLPSLQPLRPHGADPASLVPRLRRLRELVQRTCGDGFNDALLTEAQRRGLPVWLIEPDNRLCQLGAGARSRWLAGTATDADSHFGAVLCQDKSRSHQLMRRLGLPVPRQICVRQERELEAALARVGLPCVVKPIAQDRGRGVAVDLPDLEAVRAAWREAARFGDGAVLVEQQIAGADHRLMVLGGRFRFAVRREPPSVCGDGRRHLAALIEALNDDRRRRRARDGVSGPFVPDAALERRLAASGLTLASVLPAGQELVLRRNANVSTGGLRREVSGQVHAATRRRVEALAATLRLDALGVDLVTPDIGRPLEAAGGALIELNAMPQLLRERAPELLDHLFPASDAAHLPVRLVVRPSDDGPDAALAALLEQLAPPGAPSWWLAVPRRMARSLAWLGGLPLAEQLRPYDDPVELLLDASVEAVLFLLDRLEVARHGLPTPEWQGLWLAPESGAEPWPALDAWLAAQRQRPSRSA